MYRENKCSNNNKMSTKKLDVCLQISNKYATAYVIPQAYENLFSVNEAFEIGTIFKDLDVPYKEEKQVKMCNY